VPNVLKISPEVMIESIVIKDGLQRTSKLVGVTPAYFELINYKIEEGNTFNQVQLTQAAPVCIIGRGVQAKFFSKEHPIGKSIKVGAYWLKVVGVLESKNISQASMTNLGIRDYNMDIYTPVKTALVRYTNRNILTKANIQKANSEGERNNNNNNQAKQNNKPINYNQLDRLVVQVAETEYLAPTAEIIARMLQRRHLNVVDYEVSMPELLLKQQQRTKDIFNIVLGVIAGISLLVGGIGIMNIMLASVLERIKEIGLRLALGAKKTDIVSQFMLEAMLISVSGGVMGIVLGVGLAITISQFAGIPTIISASSIIVSFVVSASVGLLFGIAPAQRASQQDPISSLRYE
jgi:putative ABC transport system permease protein